MSDQPPPTSDADKELEREIRENRKFSLAEAIGRMGGPGIMKGASPVPMRQQAAAEIEAFIRERLTDAAGALSAVVIRHVNASDLLLKDFTRPLEVLEGYIRRVLNSEYLLKELVRETDMEWGQVFGERPFFEREGQQPHPDDPYTFASVRTKLESLLETLTANRF